MNILFQCSEYPPFRNGGIGTVTKIVAEELVRRGHNVYVCGYYSEMPIKEKIETVNGVTIYSFNKGIRRGSLKQKLFLLLNKIGLAGFFIQKELSWYEDKIASLIRNKHIEVLEMPDFYNFNLFKAKLSYRRFDVPTVMRVHGSASFIQHYSGKDKSWVIDNDRRHFKRMDSICSVSKFAESYIKETFPELDFKKERVIYNPIEINFLKHNAPSDNKTILFIGKLIKSKGALTLAEAFNKIATEFTEWQLRYVGKGQIEPIKKLLSPENKGRVEFLGFCNRTKVADEIDGCAFACIPTYFENFSMVPLEIMGRTRAVIFTRWTSGNEIIENGVDGFTVDPDDVGEIYKKIKTLIEDKIIRDRFAERSYQKIKNHFTTDAVVSGLIEFYNQVKRIAV